MSSRSAVLLFVLPAIIMACDPVGKRKATALRHCSACHVFPEPSLLDRRTWEQGVLPEMAMRMGLDISQLPGTDARELSDILASLPPEPLVSQEDWNSITEYYLSNAPESLAPGVENEPLPIAQFQPVAFSLGINDANMLTMVQADTLRRKIYVATRTGKLFRVALPGFAIEDSFNLETPASHIVFAGGENILVSRMGMMDPNDRTLGAVVQINSLSKEQRLLIDSLKRPVHISHADLNMDLRPDLLVSAFGNFTGALLAYERSGDTYIKHTIHNFPGTRKTIVRDYNGDGLPDIFALITQGDERLALFTNRGNFRFSYQVLLRFPPVYGSSYFELVDFNNDGHCDILYTNGDNADYSAILKPYHGIRIFLNSGDNSFSESMFYAMHGASVARAVDFDDDGDLDIAATSFFPDFKTHPERSFLYLRNDGAEFTPFTTPVAASSRWIAMECADIDNDRDIDVILGALAFPASVPDSLFQAWAANRTSLLILENTARSP